MVIKRRANAAEIRAGIRRIRKSKETGRDSRGVHLVMLGHRPQPLFQQRLNLKKPERAQTLHAGQ
jgi:hypothetical protein